MTTNGLRLLNRKVSVNALRTVIPCSALVACSAVTGADSVHVELDGRLERSAVVILSASYRGQRVADSEISWSASPSEAVSFLSDQRAEFLQAGPITISANTGTASGERSIDVAVPPTIVFDMLDSGNRDIYRAALDAKDMVRLTSHLGDDSDPTVAGDVVVFVSFRDGNGELYAMSLTGGTPERLTSTDVPEASPALSSDGAMLAYSRTDAGVPKLWVGASDGSNAARVSDSFGFAGSIEASPSWAPDGEQLAFMSTSEGTADLYTHSVSDGSFSQLVPDSAFRAEVEPAWSPDGKWVAFASDRAGDTEIYLVEVATGKLTRLTSRSGTDGQPAWTADGRLVYTAWVAGESSLRWLDPVSPATVHDIDIGAGEPGHPTAVQN